MHRPCKTLRICYLLRINEFTSAPDIETKEELQRISNDDGVQMASPIWLALDAGR